MNTLQIKGGQLKQVTVNNNIITNTNTTSKLTNKTLQKPPLPKPKKKGIKTLKQDYVCDQRRQNILNGKYLRKKQKLLQITKQNIRLFQKINSQKSLYSHQQLNKSYESNKSIMKSRISNRSDSSFYQSRSRKKSNNNINNKTSFFNRSISQIKQSKQNKQMKINHINKIQIRNIKSSNSLINHKKIQQTKPQDLKKFVCLFNITQQPPIQQRNRPSRIKSSKIIRSRTSFHNLHNYRYNNNNNNNNKNQPIQSYRKRPNNKIVINKQNQIQIHEQIKQQIQIIPSSRLKSARSISSSNKNKLFEDKNSINNNNKNNMNMNKQIQKKITTNTNTPINLQNMNLLHMQNQSRPLLSPKSSLRSIAESQKENTTTSLFQIKNSTIKDKLFSKKLNNQKVAEKYSNLLYKINQEIKKTKKPKESSIFTYKSRLIA